MRPSVLVLLLLLASGSALAQKKYVSPDDAWIEDSALLGYLQHDPYQHGEFHGYEDGFQTGDVDFHLQRPQPEFKKLKQYRSAARGYEDGDKNQYRAGYQEGFVVGYKDGQMGKPFAAFERLQAAAQNRAVEVAQDDPAVSDEMADKLELATLKAPLHIPFAAIYPKRVTIQPPGPSRESVLARIMNNLRRTFMPEAIAPQAVVAAPASAFTDRGAGQATPR